MLLSKSYITKKNLTTLSGALIALNLLGASSALAAPVKILADTNLLIALGITPTESDTDLHLSIAEVSEYQADTISHAAHKYGKCGGFERLSEDQNVSESLFTMKQQEAQAQAFMFLGSPTPFVAKNPQIENATNQVSEENLRESVQWLSSFHTRHHNSPDKNKHVEELAAKIKVMLSSTQYPYQIDFVDHTKTQQKSLRVRLEGKDRPNEVVVLGGHLDSINGPIPRAKAPGADDNASGSSNILEALRIIASGEQPSRSIEFFWYAAEEIGLVGSSEIAQSYKQSKIDVVGVMQLDMTLFPGEGEMVIGDMTDFTNPWLRGYVKSLNNLYVGAKWIEGQCGYGCSDHASWHRQGYPAVMPFEATINTMNKAIHSNKDVISPALNFKHSASFAKLAVAYALDLSNSSARASF